MKDDTIKFIKVFGVVFYSLAAFIAIWWSHPDQHFQVFEFASYKLGYTAREYLAWEYERQIRSGMQPFFVYLISKLFLALKIFNPFLVGSICRVVSTWFFLYTYYRILDFFIESNEVKVNIKLYYLFSIFYWILPLVMVRFSAEVLGATFFWLGFIWLIKEQSKIKLSRIFLIGVLWGIGFYIRIHTAIFIGIALIWLLLIQKWKIKDFLLMFFGFLFSTILELLVNYWLYNAWIWTPWAYFKVNIIEGVANSFGEMPFYFYLVGIAFSCIPIVEISMMIACLYFIIKNKRNILSWLVFMFFLIHSLISHKELRFLYSIFPILIPMGIYVLLLFSKTNRIFKYIVMMIGTLSVLISLNSFVIQSFHPFNLFNLYDYTFKYKEIYSYSHDCYRMDTTLRSENVKAYFFKNPSTNVVVFNSLDSIPPQAMFFVTKKDIGPVCITPERKYLKVYQTISNKVLNILPDFILKTIDFSYYYEIEKDSIKDRP